MLLFFLHLYYFINWLFFDKTSFTVIVRGVPRSPKQGGGANFFILNMNSMGGRRDVFIYTDSATKPTSKSPFLCFVVQKNKIFRSRGAQCPTRPHLGTPLSAKTSRAISKSFNLYIIIVRYSHWSWVLFKS